jgi:rubrerythrin
MTGRGFKEVYSLQGGIKAWQGLKAVGPVELHLDLISGDESPAEMIEIALGMEKGLQNFYGAVGEGIKDEELLSLLKKLGEIEARHGEMLLVEYGKITGMDSGSLHSPDDRSLQILEGGFQFSEFLSRNRAVMQDAAGVLDVAMMLETQALDLYLRFGMKIAEESTRTILYNIADEEKNHLSALGQQVEARAR